MARLQTRTSQGRVERSGNDGERQALGLEEVVKWDGLSFRTLKLEIVVVDLPMEQQRGLG